VQLHFEQHGKGPVDQLFGWGCAWIESFIQRHPINGLNDLLACYKAGAQDMVNSDPQGPKFHIQKFDPGETRPVRRTFFQCPNFLITRTYCLKATHRQAHPPGIQITNSVFSDAVGEPLRHWTVEERGVAEPDEHGEIVSIAWRRGFWTGERSWESPGPEPGDINELVRRHMAQKNLPPQLPVILQKDERVLVARAAARLEKAGAKKRRQTEALRESSSSDTSSSSSSTSSEADA